MVHYDRLHFTLLAIIFVLVYILASQAFLPKTSTESSTTPSPTTPSPVEDFPTSSKNPVFTSPEACPSSTVVLPEGLKGKLWYEENFFLLAAKKHLHRQGRTSQLRSYLRSILASVSGSENTV
eukprot:PhF_6_TR28276/c0_g1_i4/m.41844